MKGGNVNEFIDNTTYEECAVIYRGKKYFFHGLVLDKTNNRYSYVIDVWNDNGDYEKTVFDKTCTSMEECLQLAQNDAIFDGKTFWEAEKEMEWVDW